MLKDKIEELHYTVKAGEKLIHKEYNMGEIGGTMKTPNNIVMGIKKNIEVKT